jgi:hypothetical protein
MNIANAKEYFDISDLTFWCFDSFNNPRKTVQARG